MVYAGAPKNLSDGTRSGNGPQCDYQPWKSNGMATGKRTPDMALSEYQVRVLQNLAARRKAGGDSYVAGGVALNQALGAARVSRDIDLFHDTDEALAVSWEEDRNQLQANGFSVEPIRESVAFVEALVKQKEESTLIQWARDSAYRFFPLLEDPLLGLALHPLDLATNKVLALAGRLEPRDWVDVLECHTGLQPLGYLLWAACGKDPGYTPDFLLGEASRQHYTQTELDSLAVEGNPPNAMTLSQRWKKAVREAHEQITILPPARVGQCILGMDGGIYSGTMVQLQQDLSANRILFHAGRIGGVWPTVKTRGGD